MSLIISRKHALPLSRSTGTLTAASLLTSLAMSLPATAQVTADAPASDATTLPDIHVTGTAIETYKADRLASPKFTQSVQDTPQTVHIITRDLFNQQGATTLTEALRNSPGVGTFFVGENGNTATGDTLFMRGFDSSSSIFVDGVRDLGSISRDVFNVEQVEVTKGPAGTDTGRSAPTGAINMVSKQAIQTDAVSASLSAGTHNQKRITADWNQSLGQSGAAFRLNLMAQDSDVPGRDQVNNTRWGIAPSLAFGLGSSTRYFLNLLYVKQNNVPDGGVPTLGLPGYRSPDPARPQIALAPRVDSENFYGTDADHDDVTAHMATFRFEHDFSDTLKLTHLTRWGKNQQDYMLTAFMVTATGSTPTLTTPDINHPDGWTVARSLPTFKDQQYRLLTHQTNLRADFATGRLRHTLSTGLEVSREELESWRVAALPGTAWPAASLYAPNPNVSGLRWARNGAHALGKTHTTAFYAFDTVTLTDALLLTVGVRWDHYKTDFNSLVACTGTSCGSLPTGSIVPGVNAQSTATLFNWKLGALYKVGDIASLYANYALSQQPPGGSALELSSATNNANNPRYEPQQARTAEVGSKWNLLNENLLLSAAMFQTDVSNEVITENAVTFQGGQKRVRGIELSAVGNITPAWSLSAGYTTLSAKVKRGPNVAQDGTLELSYTPDSAFTAWTTYRLPFGLTLGGGVRYSGEMKRGTDGAIGTPTFVKSYTVWDAVASYAFNPHLDLRLNAYNLFDKDYVAAINKSGYRYTPGVPRSLLLSLNLRF